MSRTFDLDFGAWVSTRTTGAGQFQQIVLERRKARTHRQNDQAAHNTPLPGQQIAHGLPLSVLRLSCEWRYELWIVRTAAEQRAIARERAGMHRAKQTIALRDDPVRRVSIRVWMSYLFD